MIGTANVWEALPTTLQGAKDFADTKGQNNGLASLDATGRLTASQRPTTAPVVAQVARRVAPPKRSGGAFATRCNDPYNRKYGHLTDKEWSPDPYPNSLKPAIVEVI